MAIGSVMSSGALGIQRGMQGLDRNAAEIASESVRQQSAVADNVTAQLLDSLQNRTQVEASTKVVQAGSDTLGTIIDLKV